MASPEIGSAVKSNELSELSLSFIDIADELTIIFDQIDDKMSELKEALNAESLGQIMKTYEKLKLNYDIVHNNILSYSKDLISVNNKMAEGVEYIAGIISNHDFQNKEVK